MQDLNSGCVTVLEAKVLNRLGVINLVIVQSGVLSLIGHLGYSTLSFEAFELVIRKVVKDSRQLSFGYRERKLVFIRLFDGSLLLVDLH